ncbi:MAG: aromatic amino acid ammonia-lyase [Bacteroidales bacterium]
MMIIGNRELALTDFYKVLFKDSKLKMAEESLERVEKSYLFLKQFSSEKIIYGINTGFGPMAQYAIEDSEQLQLQYNLISSHAAGAGNPIPALDVRAAMIVLLNNLLQGYSGIHTDLVKLLEAFINNNLVPFVPEHGGVGASGDLVQLSHIALNLIGKGEIFYKGDLTDAGEVLKAENLIPLEIQIREGLAMMNGTSVMTGISIVNVIRAKRLLNWAIIASAMVNEIVNSFDDYFSSELNRVKQHSGQHYIAGKMRWLGEVLPVFERGRTSFTMVTQKWKISTRVQEYYSIRCVPQILGPIYDTILAAEKVFIDEANSVHDNPVINFETGNVYHGGNFHGDYVSLESDKLKNCCHQTNDDC